VLLATFCMSKAGGVLDEQFVTMLRRFAGAFVAGVRECDSKDLIG